MPHERGAKTLLRKSWRHLGAPGDTSLDPCRANASFWGHLAPLKAQLYLRTLLILLLSSPPPLPGGFPGGGPDYNFPKEITGFGLIPARIRGKPTIYVDVGLKRSWKSDFRDRGRGICPPEPHGGTNFSGAVFLAPLLCGRLPWALLLRGGPNKTRGLGRVVGTQLVREITPTADPGSIRGPL